MACAIVMTQDTPRTPTAFMFKQQTCGPRGLTRNLQGRGRVFNRSSQTVRIKLAARSPMLERPPQQPPFPVFGGAATRRLIPRAVVPPRPLQHLQVSASAARSQLVTSNWQPAVLSLRPLQHLQVPAQGSYKCKRLFRPVGNRAPTTTATVPGARLQRRSHNRLAPVSRGICAMGRHAPAPTSAPQGARPKCTRHLVPGQSQSSSRAHFGASRCPPCAPRHTYPHPTGIRAPAPNSEPARGPASGV